MVGGMDAEYHRLASVEVFDPETGAWAAAAPMSTSRFSHCVVALKDKIYAMGGVAEGDIVTDSVEVYDPATNSWSPVASMGTARQLSAAAVVQGKIFVTGGVASPGGTKMKSCEVYDPELDQWSPAADLRDARAHLAMVAE